jgi:group I intron endonuclease
MENLQFSGIYRIRNLNTGKGYVGSAKKFNARWNEHKRQLRGNFHHSILLQRSWNKYGQNAFVFEILEVVKNPTKKKLEEREQYWIDLLDVTNPAKGYNIAPKAGTSLGIKRSEETKLRNSLGHKGLPAWNKDSWKTKVSEEELIICYKDGNSMGDCRKKFGISLDTIRLVLKSRGILRSPLEGRKQEKFRNKMREIVSGKPSSKRGIKTGKKSWNSGIWKRKASEKEIVNFYNLGNSLKDCQKHFGISIDTIRMVLNKYNTIRTPQEGMLLPKAQNKRIKAFKKWSHNRIIIEA